MAENAEEDRGAHPLSGHRLVVTRAREQASRLSERLVALGAEVIEIPVLAFREVDEGRPLRAAVSRLSDWTDVIFTSQNAVEATLRALAAEGRDAGALRALRVSTVGPATHESLGRAGIAVSVQPERADADSLADLLLAEGQQEAVSAAAPAGRARRFLFPRAADGRDVLPERLKAAGYLVDVVPAYESFPPPEAGPLLSALDPETISMLTVASSNTVRYVHRLLDAEARERIRSLPFASIGPITSATARELGYRVVVEPASATMDALAEAIRAYLHPAA